MSERQSQAETRVCDAQGLTGLIDSMARQIADGRRPTEPLRLVGIRSRGFPIAERLSRALEPLVGYPVPVGAVDITLYRDDLGQGDHWPVLIGTEVPFEVDGADLVLVDDVVFTGRTVRAALNAVCDLGRPARVRFAALIDRGHRELPILADVVGLSVATERGEFVRVRVVPIDRVDEVVKVGPARAS
jgi:pyrimidine operon attenuation protein/uracil phosphoribosyltransferase